MLNNEHAVVLFSGGQDSTTCLAWALERFSRVDTVGFTYGQRHVVEIECRKLLLDKLPGLKSGWSKKIGSDHVFDLSVFGAIGGSALTSERAIEMGAQGLPTTFVPGRNLIFITMAAALAFRNGAKHLVTGVCETDYSGYPDCRDDTIKALQVALNLGMSQQFVLHTPLMWLTKAATWSLAARIAGQPLVELIRLSTHTCYQGDRSILHTWGAGCGVCPACSLRKSGYLEFTASAPNGAG